MWQIGLQVTDRRRPFRFHAAAWSTDEHSEVHLPDQRACQCTAHREVVATDHQPDGQTWTDLSINTHTHTHTHTTTGSHSQLTAVAKSQYNCVDTKLAGTESRLFQTDVSANFKVRWHKNYDKYQKTGPIKFIYCALVSKSVVSCLLPL